MANWLLSPALPGEPQILEKEKVLSILYGLSSFASSISPTRWGPENVSSKSVKSLGLVFFPSFFYSPWQTRGKSFVMRERERKKGLFKKLSSFNTGGAAGWSEMNLNIYWRLSFSSEGGKGKREFYFPTWENLVCLLKPPMLKLFVFLKRAMLKFHMKISVIVSFPKYYCTKDVKASRLSIDLEPRMMERRCSWICIHYLFVSDRKP